ncbi:receptor-interacting serine-threonine kinase [Pycnococcus provasolii]
MPGSGSKKKAKHRHGSGANDTIVARVSVGKPILVAPPSKEPTTTSEQHQEQREESSHTITMPEEDHQRKEEGIDPELFQQEFDRVTAAKVAAASSSLKTAASMLQSPQHQQQLEGDSSLFPTIKEASEKEAKNREFLEGPLETAIQLQRLDKESPSAETKAQLQAAEARIPPDLNLGKMTDLVKDHLSIKDIRIDHADARVVRTSGPSASAARQADARIDPEEGKSLTRDFPSSDVFSMSTGPFDVDYFVNTLRREMKNGSAEEFCETFGPSFARLTPCSERANPPLLGGPDDDEVTVKNFYKFWLDFKSCRPARHINEYNTKEAETREDRRWRERANVKLRKKAKKTEHERIHSFVERVLALDPRAKAFRRAREHKPRQQSAKKIPEKLESSHFEEVEMNYSNSSLSSEEGTTRVVAEEEETEEGEGSLWYRERLWRMAHPDGTPPSSACIELPPRGTPARAEGVHAFNAFFRKDRANAQLALSKSRCHMATRHNRPEHLETLITRQREDCNKPDLEEVAPIHIAAREGYDECLRILIRAKATVDGADNSGHTPIMHAVRNGHVACLKMLIDAGGISRGSTPWDNSVAGNASVVMRIAVGKNQPECLRMLIVDAGISADILLPTLFKPKAGPPGQHMYMTPLHLAVLVGGRVKCIEILINAGANVNISCSDKRRTPMHVAAFNGDATLMQMLIDAGADVNAKDGEGATPMKYAAQNGHKECVKLIIPHV